MHNFVTRFGRVRLMMSAAVILPAAFFGALAPAYAQDEGIETVTVTAEKRAENVQSVPMSISAFSGETLEQNNITNFGDLARLVPSLGISNANNERNTSIIIRNVGTSGTNPGTEPDVGVFLDGVFIPVAAPVWTELTDISTVEVLKGPQGTLYGRNTPVGAVNITTKAPSQDAEGMIDLEYGNYGEMRATGFYGGGITDDLAGRISFWSDSHDGYLKNLYNDTAVDDNDQVGGRGRLRWVPDSATTIDFIGYYSNEAGSENNVVQINPLGPGGIVNGYSACYPNCTLANSPFVAAEKATNPLHPYVIPGKYEVDSANPSSDTNVVYGASLQANRDLHGDIPFLDASLVDILAFNGYHETTPIQAPGALPLDLAGNNQKDVLGSTSNELRVVSNGTQFIDYVGGLYFFHDDLTYINKINVGPQANKLTAGGALQFVNGDGALINFGQNTTSFAAYGQATVHITDDLRATGGIRYSYDHKDGSLQQLDANVITGAADAASFITNAGPSAYASGHFIDHSVTWMFGGQYDVMKDVMGYFTIGNGFKDGGFNSRTIAQNAFVFSPETSLNYEVGAKTEWFDHKLLVNLDVYRMLVYDYQQSTLLQGQTGFVVGNAGNFRNQGVEADVQARPLDELTLTGDASFADSMTYGTGAQRLTCDKSYPFVTSSPPPSSGPLGPGSPAISSTSAYCNFDGLTQSYAPKWRWSVGARWEQEWFASHFDWFVAGDVTANSGQFMDASLDPRSWQPGYALFDASLGVEPESGKWHIELWGKNLANVQYFSAESAQTQAAYVGAGKGVAANGFVGYYATPRTIGIEGTYKF
jgi:iron complex outermembrane recepter protein